MHIYVHTYIKLDTGIHDTTNRASLISKWSYSAKIKTKELWYDYQHAEMYIHNTRNYGCAVLQNVHRFPCNMYGTCFDVCRMNLLQFSLFHVSHVLIL